MTPEEKFDYWLDIAEYDLKTAEAMFETGRWLYVVFMCQQAMEKLSKLLDEEESKTILEKTKEEFSWLLTLKPSKK
jgi:HEPN domain-containing protein